MSRSNIPVIVSINEILELLKRGVTRLNRDKFYHPERGSIQSIYGLTATEVTELFLDPRLAKKKTIVPRSSRIVIAEDMGQEEQEETQDQTGDIEYNSTPESDLPTSPYGATNRPLEGGISTTVHLATASITDGSLVSQTAYVGGTDPIVEVSDTISL